METEKQWRHRKRIVRLAKQVLEGEVELGEAAYELNEIGSYSVGCFVCHVEEFVVFADIQNELQRNCIPRGKCREQWNPVVLAQKDRMKDEIQAKYRDEAVKSCQLLIAQYTEA